MGLLHVTFASEAESRARDVGRLRAVRAEVAHVVVVAVDRVEPGQVGGVGLGREDDALELGVGQRAVGHELGRQDPAAPWAAGGRRRSWPRTAPGSWGWRLALSIIATDGVQGWYGRSSSMTAAVARPPAGVAERLGVPAKRRDRGRRGSAGPWRVSAAAARWREPLAAGVSASPSGRRGRQGLERCREQLFHARGRLRDGDGPPGHSRPASR